MLVICFFSNVGLIPRICVRAIFLFFVGFFQKLCLWACVEEVSYCLITDEWALFRKIFCLLITIVNMICSCPPISALFFEQIRFSDFPMTQILKNYCPTIQPASTKDYLKIVDKALCASTTHLGALNSQMIHAH